MYLQTQWLCSNLQWCRNFVFCHCSGLQCWPILKLVPIIFLGSKDSKHGLLTTTLCQMVFNRTSTIYQICLIVWNGAPSSQLKVSSNCITFFKYNKKHRGDKQANFTHALGKIQMNYICNRILFTLITNWVMDDFVVDFVVSRSLPFWQCLIFEIALFAFNIE